MTHARFLSCNVLGMAALAPLALIGACATTPEPEPVVEAAPEPVIVEQIRSCIPIYELERVVIPAKVKRGTSITSVDHAPVFVTDAETGEVRDVTPPPQETAVPYEVILEPEQIYYINGEGKVITDICEDEATP